MVKLEGCPWCGKAPKLKFPDEDGGCTLTHRCAKGFADCLELFATPEQAAEAWNTRPADTCEMRKVKFHRSGFVVYECSACGERTAMGRLPRACPQCGRVCQSTAKNVERGERGDGRTQRPQHSEDAAAADKN